jgi:Fibronectin type III domain
MSITTAFSTPQVTLAWDPSVSPAVAGYRLYYGVSSRTYTNVIDVGNATSGTVSNLVDSTRYFFAVTSYDVAGLESDFSDEVLYIAPRPDSILQISAHAIEGATLTASGPSGYAYNVLTSTNLLDWVPLTNITLDVTGAFQFTDPVDTNQPNRFYRLQQSSP